ncbi:MAG: hypothetical protein Q8Q09_06685 [Deltaproteobacteria bacterium]|nr:hypothetical protein [Deltaproteobacteria bacterium]
MAKTKPERSAPIRRKPSAAVLRAAADARALLHWRSQLPEPTETERVALLSHFSVAQCELASTRISTEDLAREARMFLLLAAPLVSEYARRLRYSVTRLRFVFDLLHALDNPTERANMPTPDALALAHEKLARNARQDALEDLALIAGADAAMLASIEQSRTITGESGGWMDSLKALAALGQLWLTHDPTARTRALLHEIKSSDFAAYLASALPTAPAPSPARTLKGRLVLELWLLDRALQGRRARAAKLPLVALEPALRRVLRRAQARRDLPLG